MLISRPMIVTSVAKTQAHAFSFQSPIPAMSWNSPMNTAPNWMLLTRVSSPPTRMKSIVIPVKILKRPTIILRTARRITPIGISATACRVCAGGLGVGAAAGAGIGVGFGSFDTLILSSFLIIFYYSYCLYLKITISNCHENNINANTTSIYEHIQ
jgi:hypothetical protein